MEYDQIKQLMEDMGNSKLTSLDIEFPNGIKIKMEKTCERKGEKKVVISHEKDEEYIPEKKESISEKEDLKEEEKEGIVITSPMVGTFYMKPSPDSSPYVEVGSNVKKGDIICIIEAMKLMNEIESEYDGKIAEIYVKDGESVEFGKPLFRII